ncbi:unnamed protein product [Prunus armeniaca]|uniref:Uncharacterized protein n=1 Tax=Prunus armeniaca TaxID=36596 RepID=A0A6J5UZX1_PRUAR|nr:unnamed protein product [Prunus armeniaca]
MSLGASTSPPLTERRARCIPDKDITLVFIYRKEWEGKEGSTPEWSCGNKQTEDRNWGLSHFPFTVFFASTKDGHVFFFFFSAFFFFFFFFFFFY